MIAARYDAYRAVLRARQSAYDHAVANGTLQPFIYPWESIPVLLLLLSILFIPTLKAGARLKRALSFCMFLAIGYHCFWTCRRCRTIGFAGGFGIGLVSMLGILASANLLLWNDVSNEFYRLEVVTLPKSSALRQEGSTEPNGSATTSVQFETIGNGAELQRSVGTTFKGGNIKTRAPSPPSYRHGPQKLDSLYRWHAFPKALAHRLDWTVDLVTGFRGVNWNWRVPSVPDTFPLPPRKWQKADRLPSVTLPHTTNEAFGRFRRAAILNFTTHYVLIDLIKTVVITDPYFLSTATLSSPSPWPLLAHTPLSPTLVALARLTVSLAGVIVALEFIYSLSPLFFGLVLPTIFPGLASLTRFPLLHPAFYPRQWGPFPSSFLQHGLPGLWSRSWHQMFRFGMSEPARYLTTEVLHWPTKSARTKILSVMVAFSISGAVHASASYTSFPPSAPDSIPARPMRGAFMFFFVQGIGVLAQPVLVAMIFKHACPRASMPAWLRQMGNGLFVAGWLCLTAPLLADDFARCGIWLFEPVPFSVFRGLMGEGWWWWHGRWIGLWRGKRWWQSGLAML